MSYFTDENNLRNPARDLKLIVKKLVSINDKLRRSEVLKQTQSAAEQPEPGLTED